MVLRNWTQTSCNLIAVVLLLFSITADAYIPEPTQQVLQDTHTTYTQTAPSICISQSSTIVDLVDCFDKFTVPTDFYTPQSYNLAQPTSDELTGWNQTIDNLLNLGVHRTIDVGAYIGVKDCIYSNVTNACTPALLDDTLEANFNVTAFTDSSTERSFCVLYEHTVSNGVYVRGWGLFAVPLDKPASTTVRIHLPGYDHAITHRPSNPIHLSAPHPKFDRGTPQQAAAVFGSPKVAAKSLLIAGRNRNAFNELTECIPSPKKARYLKTDPAHDIEQPFFIASLAIYEWQMAQGGCPSSTCAFIQFHGKGPSTCPTDTMFLSTGLGNESSSWYTDSIDRPIKRLQQNLKRIFPDWNATLPSESKCALVASHNIVGKFTNGVTPDDVCKKASKGAEGYFIHIEQSPVSRAVEYHARWTEAIAATFSSHL